MLQADRTISVDALFSHFFEVADFQRDYVWSVDDVAKLLSDIENARAEEDSKQYFVGAVVLSPGTSSSFSIIDGQQRMLTLFVAMAALRGRIIALDPSAKEVHVLTQRLVDHQMTAKQTIERLRILPAIDDGSAVLNAILRGERLASCSAAGERLFEAHSQASAHYRDVVTTVAEGRKVASFLLHQVALLPYVASDQGQALTVFETLNSRGRSLSALDLIKSLVFRNAPEDSWEQLRANWGALSVELERTEEQPARLLRYFLLVEHGEKVEERRIYEYIRANQQQVRLTPNPTDFITSFQSFLTAYCHVKDGRLPDGSANAVCSNVRRLTGSGRQYFPAVLALKHLCGGQAVDAMLLAIESFIMAYAVQQRYTGKIEQTFSAWALALRGIHTDADLRAYVVDTIEPVVRSAGRDAAAAMTVLTSRSLAKAKLVYLLQRLDAFLQQKAQGHGAASINLSSPSPYDIEHIHPLSAADKLPSPDDVHLIGNLTLLERPLNRAIQNSDFSQKAKTGYAHSALLLNKAMVTPLEGGNTMATAYSLVRPFSQWNGDSIRERQQNLVELACSFFKWEPPAAAAGAP